MQKVLAWTPRVNPEVETDRRTAIASGPLSLDDRLPEPNLADEDLDTPDPDDPRTWWAPQSA